MSVSETVDGELIVNKDCSSNTPVQNCLDSWTLNWSMSDIQVRIKNSPLMFHILKQVFPTWMTRS